MRTRTTKILFSIFAALCLFGLAGVLSGCIAQGEDRRVSSRRLAQKEADTTITAVIQYANEGKIDSVNRWLWNMMTHRKLDYSHQLNAAKLWLLLNGHIGYGTLPAEDRSAPQ